MVLCKYNILYLFSVLKFSTFIYLSKITVNNCYAITSKSFNERASHFIIYRMHFAQYVQSWWSSFCRSFPGSCNVTGFVKCSFLCFVSRWYYTPNSKTACFVCFSLLAIFPRNTKIQFSRPRGFKCMDQNSQKLFWLVTQGSWTYWEFSKVVNNRLTEWAFATQ